MKKTILTLFCAIVALSGFRVAAEPVVLDIPDAETFSTWTVLDANNDGTPYMWIYNDTDAKYKENQKSAADDWLISPAVTLTGNKCYNIKFYLRNASGYTTDKQKFEITIGQGQTIEAQTTQLFKKEDLQKTSEYREFEANFTPVEDGAYNIAIHTYSASYMGDMYFQKFTVDEVLPIPAAVSDITITAGAAGALEATLQWTNPSTTNKGAALESLSGAYIYRSQSQFFTADESTLVATVESTVVGGSASYTDNSMTEAGFYYYKIIPFNENGISPVSPASTKTSWIGKDSGIGTVSNVVATVVDDTSVSVNFTPATTGSNGGYIDPANVAYNISRQCGSADIVIEEAYTGELPYTDSSITELGSYTYTIKVVYNGSLAFTGVKSNAVTTGGALAIPYSENFDTNDGFQLYTLLRGPNCTKDWNRSSSGFLDFWGGGTADAYAVTPALNIETGKAYELSFDVRISSSTEASYKDLYVKIGKEASIEGLDSQIFFETIKSTNYATKKVIFFVTESGKYYVGFHTFGQTNYNDLYVDNISIVEAELSPAVIEDFNATANQNGELSVLLSWTNPSKDNIGNDLTSLSKVEILRGEDVIYTDENPVIGGECSYTDSEITQAGVYNYSIKSYLNNVASDQTTASTSWVGQDIPKAVTNASAVYSEEDAAVHISFDGVTEGVNSGYLNTENIQYTVIRYPDELVIAEYISETECTDNNIKNVALGMYYYAITATYDQYTTNAVNTEKIKLGDALELPYEADFSQASTFDIWTLTSDGSANDYYFEYNAGKAALQADFVYNKPWAFTPPFKAYKGDYKLVYSATAYGYNRPEDLEIYLTKEANYDAVDPQLIHTNHITVAAFPDDTEVLFEIPERGTYYIGYHCVTEDNWTLSIYKTNIYVERIETGVENVTTDGEAYIEYIKQNDTLVFDTADVLYIYSLEGKLVVEEHNVNDTYSLEELQNGAYIAILKNGKDTSTLKFIK